jgi:hypothetical protein
VGLPHLPLTPSQIVLIDHPTYDGIIAARLALYWQIVSPELKEYFKFDRDFGIKLRALFYNGEAERMIVHLEIPSAKRIKEKLSPVPLY